MIAAAILTAIMLQTTSAFALEYQTVLTDGTQLDSVVYLDVSKDLTEKTNMTPEMMEALLPGDLAGIGEALSEGEEQTGINALFILAIIRLESGNGSSYLARSQNNLGGIKGGDGYRTFESKQACVTYMFDLLNRLYISQGRSTISAVGEKYCESGGWAGKVSSMMDEMIARCSGESA
jgi:hypothetical protein